MKKLTRVLFAWTLVMCCAINVNAGQKILLNSNFNDGKVVFNGWGNNSTHEVVDEVLKITNPSAVNSWEAQIAYDFSTSFLPGSEYTITMKIRGSESGKIDIGLQNVDDNWKSVGKFDEVNFGVDWIDVETKCLCTGAGGKQLVLSFGQFEGDIYIDDIVFSTEFDYTWDFTKGFSEETVAGLIYDSNNWGCWTVVSDTRISPLCEQQTLTYYSSLEGKQVPIKETEGLIFGGDDYTYLYVEHGLSRPCLKFNKVNLTVTIPDLSDGMLVTIVTKTGNSSSERGIICASGNAVRVSGAEVSTEEITNIFKVTCDEGETVDVTFQPYVGGISIFSIMVTEATVETALENLNAKRLSVDSALAELDSLGLSCVAQELNTLYENDSVDETSLESIQMEIVRLDGLVKKAKEGQTQYNNMLVLVAECNGLVAVDPWEELLSALATAKILLENVSAATMNEIKEGYNTLKKARNIAIVHEQMWADWNFNIGYSNYISIDGNKKWYLDTTNKVAALYSYDGYEISVPDKIVYGGEEYVVVAIYPYSSNSAFLTSVTSVELPRTLRYIDSNSFIGCELLQSVTIPENVYYIGEYAFDNCDKLTSLRCEADFVPVLAGDFGASNLRVIYVPAGSGASYRSASYWKNYIIVDGEGVSVTVNVETPGTLGEKILEQVEYLSDVNYLTVTGSLNSDDFYNIKSRMPNLLTIDLSGTDMTALPDNMFYERYAIQKVVLPKGLKSIGNSAFYQCYSMQNIELPSTLTTIGGSAFYGCDNLTSVEIPAGVTILNNYTFYSCDNLKIVLFNEGLQTIAYSVFEGCINLTEVEFPSTLKRIEERAFYDCYKLSNVNFNEGLTTLEYDAFRYCHSLSEITLPSTLVSCYYPFDRCTNLKTVKCLSLIPPANNDNCILSSDNMESCVLYVPAWTINKYKLAKGWDQFQTIKPLDNYWPENLVLMDEFALTLPDTLPVGYKPNLSLRHTDDNSYSRYDWTYGSLSVNGTQTLSLETVKMVYDQNLFYDYGRSYSSWYTSLVNNATMRADSICITLYLRNDSWAFISFPFDVKVSDIQDILGNTNFVIRKYSGKDRAEANFDNTWQDMTVDSVLRAGEGYIWQCSRYDNDGYNQNYSGFNVSAVNNANKNLIFANETRTISLDEYLAEFSHNRSWNLIGNPFPCYYDTRAMEFTAPITVWNENNNTYNAYSPMDDAYILRPGEAFFVQRPIDKESINFPTDGRQISWEVKDRSTYNGARSVSAPRQVFNLYLSKDTLSDRTRFVINADAEMGYDMSRDASKFMSSDSRVPQLFTVEGDVHYAINERPMGNGVIALGAYFGSEGTYTLALDTEVQTEVMLVDKLTGKEVNLAAADYTFSAEAGTVTDRFEIKFGGATSVEENLAQQVSVQAVGGQIIVNGAEGAEAVVYTADGKQIATVQGNAALDVTPGLYIVKVQGKIYKVSVVR